MARKLAHILFLLASSAIVYADSDGASSAVGGRLKFIPSHSIEPLAILDHAAMPSEARTGGEPAGNPYGQGSINLVAPAISEVFGAGAIVLGESTTLTFTLTNSNSSPLTGVGFADNLPAGLTVATPNLLSNGCGGLVAAEAGSASVGLSGGLLPSSSSCIVSVNVIGVASGAQNNTTLPVTSNEAGSGGTASASVTVIPPAAPILSEFFTAAAIPLNGSSVLVFSIVNDNPLALSGLGFTDTLPSGLQVANPGVLSNGCGGTITAPGGLSKITLSAGTLPGEDACYINVPVTGVAAGSQNNITSTITSNEAGSGPAASASMLVIGPPIISATFGSNPVSIAGTSSLSIQISNPNASVLTGIGFADNLSGGLQIAVPNGLTNNCAGNVTAAAGTTGLSLNGVTLAAGGTCTIVLNVTALTPGIKTTQTSAITSNEGGSGNAALATLMVDAPPSITTTFAAASISLNGTTSLTFTIGNSNASQLTGIGFTNHLPSGLVLATPNGLANSCGTGTVSAVAGSADITVTGAALPAASSCSLVLNVTGTSIGVQNEVTSAIVSNEGGAGDIGTASLVVFGHPSITSIFGTAYLALSGSTTLTFAIANPNSLALSGLNFTDILPTGLQVANPSGLTNSCGGTTSAASNSNTVSLSNGSVSAAGACSITVNVFATSLGTKNNFTSAISSNEGGAGDSASSTVAVVGPATINAAFGAGAMPLNGTTSLTFQVSNPNSLALTGLSFTNSLPSGLQVANPSGLTNSCNGAADALASGTTLGLSAGILLGGTVCTVTANVISNSPGMKNDMTSAITSNEGGVGNAASANVNVIAPLTIAEAFVPSTIPLNGATNLSFTLTNPNSTTLSGISFTDVLPSGVVLASPSVVTNNCGGSISSPANSNEIILNGGTLAASTCSITVNVTGTTSGTRNNTTSQVNSTEGGAGNTATAMLNVLGPPSITKTFSPQSFVPGGTTILTFSLGNPNPSPLSGVAFTDLLPSGVLIATPSQLNNTCTGTAVALPGSGSVSLSDGTMTANGSCTLSVAVTAANEGKYNNVTTSVASNEGGNGQPGSASVIVASPPTLTAKFSVLAAPPSSGAVLTFTVTNPNRATALTGVSFTLLLPTGLQVSTPNGVVGSCGGGSIAATAGTASIALTGASLPAIGGTCSFSVNVTANVTGQVAATSGPIQSDQTIAGNSASAIITIGSVVQVAYAANLNAGDGVINIINTGENGADLYGPGYGAPSGNLCVNVYALAPDEQLVSCCSCLVTPDALVSLSIKDDLLSNTITGTSATSVVVKLVSTLAGSGGSDTTCTDSAAISGTLASGVSAWSTTLHPTPTPETYSVTDRSFSLVTLSAGELASLTNRCALIIGNGAGAGVCRSCRVGGLGATPSRQ